MTDLNAETPTRTSDAHHRLALVSAVAAIALYLLFIINLRNIAIREAVQWLALALAAISTAAHLLLRLRRSSLWLIGAGGGLLLCLAAIWNKAFFLVVRGFAGDEPYEGEVFRRAMQNMHAPIYGRHYTFDWVQALPMIVVAVAALSWLWWKRNTILDTRSTAPIAALFMGAMLITFAASESPTPGSPSPQKHARLLETTGFSGYRGYAVDLRHFQDQSVPTLLLRWNAVMSQPASVNVKRAPIRGFHWFNTHYPPGLLTLLKIETDYSIPFFTRGLVMLAVVLTILPVMGIVRELGGGVADARAGALLYMSASSVLIFPSINPSCIVVFPGACAMWALLRGLNGRTVQGALALAAACATFAFFSFSVTVVGVLLAILGAICLVRRFTTWQRLGLVVSVSLLLFLAFWEVVRWYSGFDLISAAIIGAHNHHEQLGGHPFVPVFRYLLRSSGAILAFMLVTSLPAVVFAATSAVTGALKKVPDRPDAAAVAVFATLVFAGFSGTFYLETERIWVFLVPMICAVAGIELTRRARDEGAILVGLAVATAVVFAVSQELGFQHHLH